MRSTKPYLLRAIYEWCLDQGFTPYIAVVADGRAVVPRQHVRDGQIVLNIGPEAAHQLVIGQDLVTLSARFSGVAQALSVPIECVAAIYARENGHGMAFEVQEAAGEAGPPESATAPDTAPPAADAPDERSSASPRPHLVRIK